MKAKLLVSTAFLAASVSLSAQKSATITLHADQGKEIIPKEIYGQFAEHLGSCIYGGLWVGENSDIPNIKGYRTDVFNALKELAVPVLRWPGGCFDRRESGNLPSATGASGSRILGCLYPVLQSPRF